jgi:hypothetical protein
MLNESQPTPIPLPYPTQPKKFAEQLTSYIANLNGVTEKHRNYCEHIGEYGFPCIISNDLLTVDNIIITLRDPSLAFFILFIDDSYDNDIATFELGLALQTKATIALIGPKPRNALHSFREGAKIISCFDWDNFIAQRFP